MAWMSTTAKMAAIRWPSAGRASGPGTVTTSSATSAAAATPMNAAGELEGSSRAVNGGVVCDVAM